MRKTALLTGVAGLLLVTAPAFAQDTAPQTPPTEQPSEQPAAQPQQLTLQPGSVVRGSDGAELGRLEGVRNGPSGQELTVRGSDGQLRGVSTAGVRQEGDAVVVEASSGQFQSSPVIAGTEPAPAQPTPPDPATPAQPAAPVAPATPAEPTQPMAPPAPAEPAQPTTAPSADQPPPPGEGVEPTPGPDAAPPAPGEDDEPTTDEPGS